MHPLIERVNARREQMLEFLEILVNTDSPSTEPELTSAISRIVGDRCEELGAEVEYIRREGVGDHMKAVWRGDGPETGGLLILCHLDTVWPAGEAARRPFQVEGNRATGPGVHDMKGGVVQTLFTLEEVLGREDPPEGSITLLCNTDEEIGSATSRDVIESLALQSRAVLVLEPPVSPDGSLKTFRKGVGSFAIEVTGRAAHAGADHSVGISAVEEMARQIQYLHSLSDRETQTTVNVGVVRGGSRSNVVAADCHAEVDVRVMTAEEGRRMERVMRDLEPFLEGAQIQVSGGVERPPMERTDAIVEMFEVARELGKELGLDITEAGTGGASDGNFTAALGIPTLDGLGAVGSGGHALHECIEVDAMIGRTALLIRLLQEI
ncbi:MAG: M20 family metallopeptidase [Bacillota bacterium]